MPAPSTAAPSGGFLARSRFLAPLLVYSAFAGIVFVLQGFQPELSIDHVSYFKLANEIRERFPEGDYWRSFNAVRGYGVLLAYLHDLTGSHIASLKVLLFAMTLAYLGAFQLFMGLTRATRAQAILFSLLSALFVSFGATIWGVTDFTASLNRTLIIPFVLVLVWFFFGRLDSGWRYLVYPALVLLSLVHLSALHVFLVFGAFEGLDFLVRRRCRLDRSLAQFALALAASIAMQGAIEGYGSGAAGYVRFVLAMTQPATKVEAEAPVAAPAAGGPVAAPAPSDRLTAREAWRIELLAFPWRNFPPPLATVATVASSYGVIFLLALLGAVRVFRAGKADGLDRSMATFAVAVPLVAYGLQATMWILRQRTQVLPINFEEIRAINMIMIPSTYFAFRLYELAPAFGRLSRAGVRVAIVVAFALQPIVLLRATPAAWREVLVERMVDRGIVKRSDALRMLYARQFLGLGGDGCRFYYSSKPAIEWLERHADPEDRVLTNLNEFHMFRDNSIGPFLGVVKLDVWDLRRAQWAQSTVAIDAALASRDVDRVLELGRSLGATYAVVNWPVEHAAHRDACYSIVRVR